MNLQHYLFGLDPYADARQFYGAAFPEMLKQQAWFAATEQDGRAVAPMLVDDVASQIVGGPAPWRCAAALRQGDRPQSCGFKPQQYEAGFGASGRPRLSMEP